jgi:hypothetical protein
LSVTPDRTGVCKKLPKSKAVIHLLGYQVNTLNRKIKAAETKTSDLSGERPGEALPAR